MKIDFIIGSLTGGGAERVLVLLANWFSQKGYRVRIITFNEGDAYDLNNNLIRVKLHKGKIKNNRIRNLDNLRKFYKKGSNRPDVIISFISLTNLIAIIIAKIYKIKIIVSEHNSYLRAQHPKYLTNFTRTFLYPKADYVTVLTHFDVEYYEKKNVNVVVMPNPCSFKIYEKSKTYRYKTILAVGNLDRYYHKGFDNLIPLISPILKKHKDWDLKFIGGGKIGLTYLTNLVKKHEIEKQVSFTGFIKDVNIIMQQSEIFVLSSRYEGLPMVLLEAMSQGMTCISYDCKTGPSDIINHGENGLLIEDQNMEAMQKGLEQLISERELRENLRLAANKTLDRYSIDKIAERWENIFVNMNLPI